MLQIEVKASMHHGKRHAKVQEVHARCAGVLLGGSVTKVIAEERGVEETSAEAGDEKGRRTAKTRYIKSANSFELCTNQNNLQSAKNLSC